MAGLTFVALVLVAAVAGAVVRSQRRAFAVRRYEHTYSAIDAAVGRARRAGTVPLLNPASGADSHVLLVPPPARRRAGNLAAAEAGEAPGVSPPLAG